MSELQGPQPGEFLLYETEDGRTRVECRFVADTLWLPQGGMADLFQTSKQNVAKHLKSIFAEAELDPASVVNQWLTTAADGKNYRVAYYNLDAILAVGYRVRSARGTQFRRWATERLREYLVKGFTLDDERLKNPPVAGSAVPDRFDELLERIRDIRASERRMYLRDPQGLPISVRLLCEAHRLLLDGARGAGKQPGELRRSQNWIGGTRPGNAAFVPPPPLQVDDLLTDLERFTHAADADLPPLVRVALIHAQFETIHPFLDGNGRIGRLLIAALMEQWGLLREPLMYLSGYLKQHQAEYYRRLSAIRGDGDWEGWVSFFLEGVAVASAEAERSIIDVASLITADRKRLLESPKAGPISYRLFELLPMMPRFSVEHVRQRLETTFPTASAAVKLLEDLGILGEITGQKKNRVYSYQAYVELLSR